MKQSEMKNAPWLGGWVIAAAAGLVAAGATYVVGDFNLRQAVFVGVAISAVVGLFMGMPWGAGATAAKAAAMPVPKPVATPMAAPVMMAAEPAMATPMAPPMAAAPASVGGPAAMFTSAPVAEAPKTKPARLAKPKVVKPVAKAAAQPAAAKAPKAKKPAGPTRLTGPRKGKADDLKEIEGIGPALEKLCHSLGFYHFDQIAGWSDADVALVDAEMKTFKGRITRDKWVAQSKIIVTEGLEAFRVRAQTNNY